MSEFKRDGRGEETASNVDLSFSQILEVHSSQPYQQQQQYSYQKKKKAQPPPRQATQRQQTASLQAVTELSEELDEDDDNDIGNYVDDELDSNSTTPHSPCASADSYDPAISSSLTLRRSSSGLSEDDWIIGDDRSLGTDVYRFVQPRRLSSWVSDDAVNACFKCQTLFTLMIRKHHCRACGRIFCNTCSSQRVVIPPDYESTPASVSYNQSLTSNASDLIGNISWYLTSYTSPSSQNDPSSGREQDYVECQEAISHLERHERFLQDVERLQRQQIIHKFTPSTVAPAPLESSALSSSVSSSSSSLPSSLSKPTSSASLKKRASSRTHIKSGYVPEGSTLQRVCDDCACALQQRRQHYNTVQVFKLCQFDLKELRVLGQVCRKWHRASIMCLSRFRQIQYDLPTQQLSDKERGLLILNRQFLAGHSKWLVQLIKAIDFSRLGDEEEEEEAKDPDNELVNQVLALLQQPRRHSCMLTMCSRLCKREIGAVDAVEILANENIRHKTLRKMCVDALTQYASDEEWISFLPVLLHSLHVEANAVQCPLGHALIRQAKCDVRFCNDLFWNLTVMSEDVNCRRKFDGLKQCLLLALAEFGSKSQGIESYEDTIAMQLLRGQQFVDIMYKIPPRIPVLEAKAIFQRELYKARLLTGSRTGSFSGSGTGSLPLRLPVDPRIKIGGIDFDNVEIKNSAEAPMIIKCIDVERDEESQSQSQFKATTNDSQSSAKSQFQETVSLPYYRIMYKRDDLRKDAIVQNIISVMYQILKHETRLDIPLVTYRVVPTSSFDGIIEIVENADTLYRIINKHGKILNYLHHYNSNRTIGEISSSFRESLAAYTVITFLLGVGDRHAENVMITKGGILFHIDYGFILGKDPKPLQPPMRLDDYMVDALGGLDTPQFEEFKSLCVLAFNCLRRHVNLVMIMLSLVVRAMPEITDFSEVDTKYTQSDLEKFVIERFLPGQSDDEAAKALVLRMEGKFNERLGQKLSDFVHTHASEKTVSKGMLSVGSSVKSGVETVEATVSTVASSLSTGASSIYNYVWKR